MFAMMVVCMNITDPSWISAYFAEVPKIFAEYGGVSIAGSRQVASLEGSPSDRMAVLSFPSLEAITAFMQDARYQSFRKTRERGARTDIFVFENGVVQGELV